MVVSNRSARFSPRLYVAQVGWVLKSVDALVNCRFSKFERQPDFSIHVCVHAKVFQEKNLADLQRSNFSLTCLCIFLGPSNMYMMTAHSWQWDGEIIAHYPLKPAWLWTGLFRVSWLILVVYSVWAFRLRLRLRGIYLNRITEKVNGYLSSCVPVGRGWEGEN